MAAKSKEVFQDGLRPFSAVTNLLQYVDDVKAEEEVQALSRFLCLQKMCGSI